MKVHRTFKNIICFIILGFPLSSFGAGKELVIAVEDDAAPWSQKDGTGYANDLVKEIYSSAGLAVRFAVLPYSRCKSSAISGKYVGCFNMGKVTELEADIAFPETPLFLEYISYFHSTRHPIAASHEKDITPKTKIGIVRGYEYSALFHSMLKSGLIKVLETNSEVNNLKMLKSNRVDAVLLVHNETKPAEYLLKAAGVDETVQKAFTSEVLELHIGFSRKHPDFELAFSKYKEGMVKIKANGSYAKITDEWISKSK